MSLRVLIADSYYPGFLGSYYGRFGRLTTRPYAEQHDHLLGQRFGTGHSCVAELRKLGCQADSIILNANPLQRQWALEHEVPVAEDASRWHPEVFIAQVRFFRPDVLYVQELSSAGDDVLQTVKPYTRLIVGQVACSLPGNRSFLHHDLIVSSWPPLVEHFRAAGKPSELLLLAFDADVPLPEAGLSPGHRVSFVGGLAAVHTGRIALLEHLCHHLPMDIFGYGVETLPQDSLIRRHHRGPAWGLDAYRALAASGVTVNAHGVIEVAGRVVNHLANNARLFDATGMGTLLVTDWKENIGQLFTPDREIVTYASAEECVSRVRHYLDHPEERRSVAQAGRRRTLAEHTYRHRMQQLIEILRSRL